MSFLFNLRSLSATSSLLLAVTFMSAQQPPSPLPAGPAGTPGKTLVGSDPVTHYIATIEQWRAGRIQRLTAPTGWLALIGRHPLTAGTWTVGSAPGNTLRLAAGPERLGTLTHGTDGRVTFAFAEGATGTIDGTAGREAELVYQGENPTFVRSGTINFYILNSAGKLYVRVRDTESERRKHFAGIEAYPIDPAWRIEADWVPFDPPRSLRITNVVGVTGDERCPGKAIFQYAGKTYELLPMQDEPGDQLFFVLTDTTAGSETYEASRFLYAEAPKDGKVILDFNKVYNPPCAFTPFTTCPLPPKENVLTFPLRAGEKKYQGEH
jgi:uncharacterized protein (DUF1684 family)